MDTQSNKNISCKLTAPELQRRKASVIAELKSLILSRTEEEQGVRYLFDGHDDILDKLNTFVKTERLCCDFFIFQLTVRDDKAELLITGPEGAKEFLKEEIDL